MYTLIKNISTTRMALESVFSLGVAWLVAEIFYKLGSFTLELAAFLLTWLVIDWLVQALTSLFVKRPAGSPRA